MNSVMNEINNNNWKLKFRIILHVICFCGVTFAAGTVWGQTAPNYTPGVSPPASNSVGGEAAVAAPPLNQLDTSPIPVTSKVQDSLQLPANQVPLQSDGSAEKDPRLKGIFDRIKLLNKIMEEDRNALEPENAATNPTPSELVSGNPPNPETAPVTNPATESTGASDSLPPSDVPAEIAGGSQVLAEPINSLELGNSLYMTANYPAAIRSYSMLLKQKMDNQDAAWLRLMLGCCYRYQDDYTNAESIFRNVADRRGAGDFLMKHTTWNLQYLEERRKRRDDFQAVETELDSLILEINNESTQK